MSLSGILNPLTIVEAFGAPKVQRLELRSFAPGRSLLVTDIERSTDPALFEQLWDWAEHGEPDRLTDLSRDQYFWLWSNGLLLSEAEAQAMPEGAAPSSDPSEVAIALFPPIRDFLSREFRPLDPGEIATGSFQSDRACLFPQLFEQADFEAIKGYYRLLQDGNWLKPDSYLTRQKVVRNDPVARHIHAGIKTLVEKIVGDAVTPTLTYSTQYHGMAPLPRHFDREQSTYTISLFIEYRPDEHCGPCPWPLYIHAGDRDLVFRPDPGGAVMFKGCELEHSRPALPDDARAMQVILSFAPAGFAGPLI